MCLILLCLRLYSTQLETATRIFPLHHMPNQIYVYITFSRVSAHPLLQWPTPFPISPLLLFHLYLLVTISSLNTHLNLSCLCCFPGYVSVHSQTPSYSLLILSDLVTTRIHLNIFISATLILILYFFIHRSGSHCWPCNDSETSLSPLTVLFFIAQHSCHYSSHLILLATFSAILLHDAKYSNR